MKNLINLTNKIMLREQTSEIRPREEKIEEFIEKASDFLARAQNEAKMYFVIEGGEKKITTGGYPFLWTPCLHSNGYIISC